MSIGANAFGKERRAAGSVSLALTFRTRIYAKYLTRQTPEDSMPVKQRRCQRVLGMPCSNSISNSSIYT
jgi:hypothetical protein